MKPSIPRMLFATDLSQNSTYALRHAANLAKLASADAEDRAVRDQAASAKARIPPLVVPYNDD